MLDELTTGLEEHSKCNEMKTQSFEFSAYLLYDKKDFDASGLASLLRSYLV